MIDKERLLKGRLTEFDHDIPDVGTVRARLLSWEECSQLETWTEKGRDAKVVYRTILATAMVDPSLTEDEAAEWMASATGGEIETLVREIVTRSGMAEGAQKSV